MAHVGTYIVTVKAVSGCEYLTESYTVNVVACGGDTLTIDNTVFASPAATYDIRAPILTFNWMDTAATSSLGLSICGALSWSVTN